MSTPLIEKIREYKGREWWIVRSSDKDISADGFIYVRNPYHSLQIHVVEASRLKVLEDALVVAIEALRPQEDCNGYVIDKLLKDCIDLMQRLGGYQNCYSINAVIAERQKQREALQKIEAILGEK